MKKIRIGLLTIMMVVVMTACGASSDNDNQAKEITNSATYEKCELVLYSSSIDTLETGEKVIKIAATFKNSDSDQYTH